MHSEVMMRVFESGMINTEHIMASLGCSKLMNRMFYGVLMGIGAMLFAFRQQ